MNPQERLSPRVRAVIDALNHVQEIRREWTDDEPLKFLLFQHKETEEVGVNQEVKRPQGSRHLLY